jgi:hypothetical protein
MIKSTSDRAATVDTSYHWLPVGPDTPRGTKVQLIDRKFGVAVYGAYQPGSQWTHWAPLPTFRKDGDAA